MPTKPEEDSGGRVWPRPEIVVPNPDPSEVTLRYIDNEVDNLEKRIGARIEGMEKAVQVFHDDLVRVPTLLDRSVLGLRELLEERMDGMDALSLTLKERVEGKNGGLDDEISHLRGLMESKIDLVSGAVQSLSNVTTQQFISINDKFAEKDKAVSVGLSAQKESAAAQQASNADAQNKMEANFTKLLDQGRELLSEFRRNTELQINDIKGRLDKGEGKTSITEPGTSDEIGKLRAAILNLATSRDTMVGHAQGVSQTTAMLIAIGGALSGAAIALISKFM